MRVIFPELDWQILSQQNSKENSSTSDVHRANILPSTAVAQLKQVEWCDGGRNPWPLGSIPKPRPQPRPGRPPQFHERSPCVFLQPASIREEEAGSLPYHISFHTGSHGACVAPGGRCFTEHCSCQSMRSFISNHPSRLGAVLTWQMLQSLAH